MYMYTLRATYIIFFYIEAFTCRKFTPNASQILTLCEPVEV